MEIDIEAIREKIGEGKYALSFTHTEKLQLKVIENVPAGVCQQCGEKYFRSAIYKAMEKLAASRAKPAARLTVDVVRFKKAV